MSHCAQTKKLFTQKLFRELRVSLVRAKNLVAKDRGGTSDPFVRVWSRGVMHETQVKTKTLAPEWNESFTWDLRGAGSDDSVVELIVYDHDKGSFYGSSAEYLGSVSLSVSSLEAHAGKERWYPLIFDAKHQKKEEPITGAILLKFDFVEMTQEEVAAMQTKEMKDGHRLQLTVLAGKNLMAADRGGTSDPYVRLRLGDSKEALKTKVIKKNLNPEWNETFDLKLERLHESLTIECFDYDLMGSDDSLGKSRIRLKGCKMSFELFVHYGICTF